MKRNIYTLPIIYLILTGSLLGYFPADTSAQESCHFSWLHPRPQGQSIRNIVTLDQNKWYGVTLSGDFIRTINGGREWSITENIGGTNLSTGNPYSLYDLEMFDKQTGLVCGEDGLLARTTNGGVSWTNLSGDSDGTWYDMFFINAKTGFVSGEASNGIRMTTDGGENWSYINSPSADAFSIYAFDENIIFTTSTEGRIFSTSNGGQSWNEFSTGTNDTLLKINFYNKGLGVVCGTSNTVKITTNRGLSWDNFNTNLPENTWYDIDFQIDRTIIPVSESFNSQSFPPPGWSSLNNSGSSVWESSTVSPYLGPSCAWSNFDPVMGDNVLLTPEVEITSGDELSFYLRRSYTGTIFNWDSLEVFVTGRGGNTIRYLHPLVRIGLNSKDTSASTYPPRIGTYKRYSLPLDKYIGNIVQVGFRHKNTDGTGIRLDEILVGTYRSKSLQRIYLTGNRVNIYRNTIDPFVRPNQPWMPIPFINSQQIYKGDAYTTSVLGEDSLIIAGANGFFNKSYSSTGNQSYSDRNTDNNLFDLWTNSEGKKMISIGSAGVILTSQNEGQSWTYNKISEKSLYSISMINENTGWIAGSEGHLYRTTDGGSSWNKSVGHKAINLVFKDFHEVFFVGNKIGWAFGQNAAVIKTTDGGISWKKQNSNIRKDITIFNSFMLNKQVGYFVGQHGIIQKTTNGGENWLKLDNPNVSSLRGVFMLDEMTGWICGDDGVLLKTTNGGKLWDSVSIPYPQTNLYAVQFLDKDIGMVVGESGKTFRTSDGGATWVFENSGATDHYALNMLSPEVSYISSSNGNIIKYNGASDTGREIAYTETSTPKEFTLDQNFPNPFNPSTTISFSIPHEGYVSLKIYDASGREVSTLINNEVLNSGTYSKSFIANNLASGVYFYSILINGKISLTRKMLLIK
jgi:photosystem II stability/assembly factor-like uncharacterized protein